MKVYDLHLPKDIEVKERHVIHTYTNYHKEIDTEVLIIKERVIDIDGNHYPNLRMIVEPEKDIYVTKPQFRINVNKREREKISNLDMYRVKNKDVESTLQKVLGIRGRYIDRKTLINNPYVYGADIDIESYYKMLYLQKTNEPFTDPSVAMLDIESDLVFGTKMINCASVTIEGKVFSFINKPLMQKMVTVDVPSENGIMTTEVFKEISIEEIKEVAYKLLSNTLKETNYEIEWCVCESEIDLIKQMINVLHQHHIDFSCIWNMDYDVNELVKAIQRANEDPANIFSDPKIPDKFKSYRYKKDTSTDKGHFVLKWHFAFCPSTFQFIDNMALYAWNRRTQPFEESYKLDDILTKHLGEGKLFVIDDHESFQKYRFDEYVAYNITDTLNFYIAETTKINDIKSMMVYGQNTALSRFNSATVKSKNAYYRINKAAGYIIASVHNPGIRPGEEHLIRIGGAVLSSANAYATGLRIILEDEDLITLLSMFVNDADFTSIYPTLMIVLNISVSTHLCTPYAIDGAYAVYDYFSKIICQKENINALCVEYFNLASYREMDSVMKSYLK